MTVSAEKQSSSRIAWVDLCKVLGMLLVIAGHNMFSVPCYAMIYSFHMPLFFLLSAFTMKPCSSWKSFLKKTFRSFLQLVVTAVILFIAAETLTRFADKKSILTVDYLKQLLRSLFFNTGMVGIFNNVIVEPVGICWFLVVLFCARTLFLTFQLLLRNKEIPVTVVCTVLGIIGVLLSKISTSFTAESGSIVDGILVPSVNVWPFALDVTLAVMPFMALGNLLQKNISYFSAPKNILWKRFILSACGWAAGFAVCWFFSARYGQYFDLICRRYPLFPLCMLVAAIGSVSMMLLCSALPNGKIINALTKLGRHTLPLLCIHKLDPLWEVLYTWTECYWLGILCRIAIDLFLLAIFLAIRNAVQKLTTELSSAT